MNTHPSPYLAKVSEVQSCQEHNERVSSGSAHHFEPRLQEGGKDIPDTELSKLVKELLNCDSSLALVRIDVDVKNGIATLKGEVENWFQKNNAYNHVVNILGIEAVRNELAIRPKVDSEEIKQRIRNAFLHIAETDASKIEVDVQGNIVVLDGVVHTNAEKKDADYSARSGRGVSKVINRLKVAEQ